MDPSIISALSAIFGSLVGGSASIATAWFTQRAQSRRESINPEIKRRELLYTEFINECSKLTIDAFDRILDSPATLVQVYALLNRIRLTSSDTVFTAAEQTMKSVMDQYYLPKVSIEELRKMAASMGTVDPLQTFSVGCRQKS